ncbi:MAG: hypothetical protein ACI3XD_00035, partial [Oscillospiraceae bacterium]
RHLLDAAEYFQHSFIPPFARKCAVYRDSRYHVASKKSTILGNLDGILVKNRIFCRKQPNLENGTARAKYDVKFA